MLQSGQILADKYEILKEIGRGGMSVVYLAMDRHLNKQWAVKEILREKPGMCEEVVTESLLAEANLMKRLDHYALPRIVDILEFELTICIVMDYIEGESLDTVLGSVGHLSEQQTISIAKQMCDVLYYLHSQTPPIIYRDVKPANIMLKPDGHIKIIDFGTAREYKQEGRADTRILGTRGYAPPEQYAGKTSIQSDLYALGMTMQHLLTGEMPIPGAVRQPIHLRQPDCSESMDAIIGKCTQPAQADRYASCLELLYDLEHPELVTRRHRIKQKLKLVMYILTIALSVLFFLSGVFCRFKAKQIKNTSYESMISLAPATDDRQRRQSYEEAIRIYPERPQAYLCLLELFGEDGRFEKEENDIFLAVYNAHKDILDWRDPMTAMLNYKAGLTYLNYYEDEAGEAAVGERTRKAYAFFEMNHEHLSQLESFEYIQLSECYFRICSFYKRFILQSALVDEASGADYEDLMIDLAYLVSCMSEGMEDAGAHDMLTVGYGALTLIYDQRQALAKHGIEMNQLLAYMDQIYRLAKQIQVSKTQSLQLREAIMKHYDSYRRGVIHAYGAD